MKIEKKKEKAKNWKNRENYGEGKKYHQTTENGKRKRGQQKPIVKGNPTLFSLLSLGRLFPFHPFIH